MTKERRLGYDRLACYDPESGEEAGNYTAVSEALALERQLRSQAEDRALVEAEALRQAELHAATLAAASAQAEARIRELEAAITRLSHGPQSQ